MKNEIQSGLAAAETFLIFNSVVLMACAAILFEEIGPFSAMVPGGMLAISFFVYRKLKYASSTLGRLDFLEQDTNGE